MSVMGFFLYQKYVRSDELKILVHGNRVVNIIASNVNEINSVGSGYTQYFTLEDSLYGRRNYSVSFFQNESTVYLRGGSFVRGIELFWSAPISTINVGCLMSECNAGCNKSTSEVCLMINDTMNVRVTNQDGVVYLTYPYNIRQNKTTYYITPLRGNDTFSNSSCPKESIIYIYENTADGTRNLVFKHNSTNPGDQVRMSFSDLIGDLNVTISDDPNELTQTSSSIAGTWDLNQECDGGAINFKEGINLCIQPTISTGLDWLWLNGDGTNITLDKTQDLCLSYP
jgi:hypothetical protein